MKLDIESDLKADDKKLKDFISKSIFFIIHISIKIKDKINHFFISQQ